MRLSHQKNQKDKNSEKEINDMLTSVEPMIWSILSKYGNLTKGDMEDLKQEILIFLWEKIIPAYDYNKANAKFSSFAYRCIVNFINRKIQKIKRNHFNETNAAHIYYDVCEERHSDNVLQAREKVHFFEKIIKNNEIKLRPKEKIVINLIINNPDITQRTISTIMGYKHPSAISMMLLRLRRRLKKSPILKNSEIITEESVQ